MKTPETAPAANTLSADSLPADQADSTGTQVTNNQAAADSAQQGISRFLLVGCERSGTTMLRLMLDHHPQLSCLYESDYMVQHFYKCHGQPLVRFNQFLKDDWHFLNSELPLPEGAESYEEAVMVFFRQRGQSSGTKTVGATIHQSYTEVPKVFPEVKYLNIIRDGRPVAASIMRMGWTGNVYHGALRWRQKIEEIITLQQQIPSDRWLTIRYEDLVAEPALVLGSVCQFLGVEYSADMVNYNKDTTYDKPDVKNAQRWRKVLSPRQIHQIEMAAGDLLKQSGYALDYPPEQPGFLERLILNIHNRIARGVFNCKRFSTYLVLTRKFWRLVGMPHKGLERRYRAIYEAHFK